MLDDQNKYKWADEVNELQHYFSTIELPKMPVSLGSGIVVVNSTNFVNNHIATLKANVGNRIFYPYLTRLREFKSKLNPKN
jgi:hypothetical protein